MTSQDGPSLGRSGAPAVERVARKILNDCLVEDGSLFTPGTPIWSQANLFELQNRYVASPLTSGKSFSEKIAAQLSGVTDGARQLFAELHVLNVLPLVNLKQSTKLALIERVLAPMTSPPKIPGDVEDAFAHGVFGGGRGFSSRRWAQLAFLVEFADYFKNHEPFRRREAVADPLLMRMMVSGAPGPRERAQRQALLYMFHPEYFLPIVSAQHRTLLRDTLADDYLPGGPSEDLDIDLRRIDDAVKAEFGGPVDYYQDPWVGRWLITGPVPSDSVPPLVQAVSSDDDNGRDTTPFAVTDIIADGCFHLEERLEQILKRWDTKKNLILQGAPGTGKTWLAKRLAYALIGFRAPDAIRSVQFHPNTSYEDFVRGWRPTVGEDGSGRLVLADGPLIAHAERARSSEITHVLIIEEINRGNPAQAFGEMLTLIEATKRSSKDALSLSYPRTADEQYHLPANLYIIGTMNIADRSLALVDFALRRRFCFETLAPAFTSAWEEHMRECLPNQPELVIRIRDAVSALNERISADRTLGAAFVIGHSFFTAADVEPDGRVWYIGVVESEIRPLLSEYWFDDPEKVEQATAELLAIAR